MISVIVPANNEEAYIAACLEAILAQETARAVEVVVAANGCTDRTLDIVLSYRMRFSERGWVLKLLDIEKPGKPNALNSADAAASGAERIYLDADVIMSPTLVEEIAAALELNRPVYASGRMRIAAAKSWATRAYGRIWARLPFVTQGVPGAGLFAVNAAARARWESFPEIISDDTYVRLKFAPEERVLVEAFYEWPLVEGIAALVRVRRRQNRGVEEVYKFYPELMENKEKNSLTVGQAGGIAFADPLGFLVYAGVSVVQTGAGNTWSRGR